jgi:glyoxylase-like metal-dependent hydrolase (beta-lactamase superfamily II)
MHSLIPITHFDGARNAPGQRTRVEDTRAAAQDFRRYLLAGPKVRYFESFDLIKLIYPARYGLRNAYSAERLNAYVHINNRVFVVQYDTPDGLKTLLVSPSDHERGGETPFFRRLQDSTPKFIVDRVVTRYATVPEVLQRIGLRPADIDYITYDHLHTQDVRRWLGSDDEPALLPNAKLLVHQREWTNAQDLSPYQRDWYCPHGVAGVAADKVLRFDGSVLLGDGIALVHTPGHTEGNHSIVVNTDEGLWVISENGISVDAYAPQHSTLWGVAKYAKAIGSEVILNGNTLENSVDQYISMVQELTIAGPSRRDPRFPNMFPSSELSPFWLFPGTRPGFLVQHAAHGQLLKPGA